MEKKIFFLNIDFDKVRTGIENASLLRARLFSKYLGISPILITAKYNNHLLLRIEELIKEKLINSNISILNPYVYYQKTDEGKKQTTNLTINSNWKAINVANTYDYRIYDNNGKLMIYRVCDNKGNLNYNNIFHNGKKIRRDYYDHNGYLSKIQYLDFDTGHPIFETYYTIYGEICMHKYYKIVGNKNVLEKIHLVNDNGFIENSFNSEDDFLSFWLQEIIPNNENVYLIIDKERIYYPIIKKWNSNKRKVLCCIHSTHLSNNNNYLNGKINSNYKDIFDDIEKPDAIIVLTKRQKQHIVERFGHKGNVVVIPHVVENSIKKVDFSQRESYKCIYLARFSPEKQHDKIINVFHKVIKENPKIKLYLYGNGAEKNKIQNLINEKGLNDSVFINDFTNNVEEIYHSAQLSISTSKVEGFSLFILESLSNGVPTISFDIDYGPSDLIDHGENGFLVQNFDEDQMAEYIIRVFDNIDFLRMMSEKAYLINNKFNAEKVIKKWGELLGIY